MKLNPLYLIVAALSLWTLMSVQSTYAVTPCPEEDPEACESGEPAEDPPAEE